MTKAAVKKALKSSSSKKSVKPKAKPATKLTVVKPAFKNDKVKPKLAKAGSVKTPAVKAVAKVVTKLEVKSNKSSSQDNYEFKINDYLVYPTHGVGLVTNIEKTEIAGTQVTLYVLSFEKEKMTLRVPVTRAQAVGLRRLASSDQMSKAMAVLKSKPKSARGMWSRRATEYGQKINSGNIEFIAQVVRDLHKNVDDPDRSYSERIIYESAFNRLAGEYAAINKLDAKQAEELLVKTLGKKSLAA